MDETRIYISTESNSNIPNNKIDIIDTKNNQDNAKYSRPAIKRRGVYVEKYLDTGIGSKKMEEVLQGSNKTLIESSKIFDKPSKATQSEEKNIIRMKPNLNKTQIVNKKDEGNKRKAYTGVNIPTIVKSKHYAAGKSPVNKTANPANKLPKVHIQKTAQAKSKIAIANKTATNPETANIKIEIENFIPKDTAQNIERKLVARRVKRHLFRKESPVNTLISDKTIIQETPKGQYNDIETKSVNILDLKNEHEAKIYSLIKDFLESIINTCSDNLSNKSYLNLLIDEEVAKKLVMINNDDEYNSMHSFSNCPDTIESSMTTIRKCFEDIKSLASEKTQEKRNVSSECMAVSESEAKNTKEAKIKNKRLSKKNTKPICIGSKTNALVQMQQKTHKRSAPMPKFVNRSDYLVQHIYNIQLDSRTLKTKKIEVTKSLKNPLVFQKPQNFFETLSLILKNKNRAEYINNKIECKLKDLMKLTRIRQKQKDVKQLSTKN